MVAAGIREVKNNLSRYVRRVEKGERIAITAHGRVVAEMGPPGSASIRRTSRLNEMIAAGVARGPLESGDPLPDVPRLRVPSGTAAALLDEDRSEE